MYKSGISSQSPVRDWERLKFSYFIASASKDAIFASAKDKNGRVYNFIINAKGEVKEQVNRGFEPIKEKASEAVRRAVTDFYGILPTYRTKKFIFS